MLRALRYRNYRLFFGGQIVSLAGTWITTTATSWLVYRLTGSALLLGLVGFAGQFPAFLLGPFAGIVVDRWDRRRLLVVTQTVSMLQSFALAALTLSGRITVESIVLLNVVQGIVNAFDMPGRQAFVIAMIENKDDLGNAIALNSSMVNVARLVGPSIAGIVIAATNEGWCFLIDGVSYLGVIVALLAMRIAHGARAGGAKHAGAWQQFMEGWQYAFGFRPDPVDHPAARARQPRRRAVFGADADLRGDRVPRRAAHARLPHDGVRLRRAGRRALAGDAQIGRRPRPHHRDRHRGVRRRPDRVFVRAELWRWRFRAWSSPASASSCRWPRATPIIQTIVDDEKRGRVMSFYMMAFLGTAPFGSLIAGWMSSRIGAPHTLLVGGICCRGGRGLVLRRAAADPTGGAADLHQDGHPAAGGRGLSPRRRSCRCRRSGRRGCLGAWVQRCLGAPRCLSTPAPSTPAPSTPAPY